MSISAYPIGRSSCMTNNEPVDRRFQIHGGTLKYKAERDARFPYIYQITTHALVHAPEHFRTILIHIVDTSEEALVARAKFEKSLSVPLGPDALMDNYGQFRNFISFGYLISPLNIGLFELEPGTVLFARPLTEDGIYHEEDDIVEAWCMDG